MQGKNIFKYYRKSLVTMFLNNPDLGDEIYYLDEKKTKAILENQIRNLTDDEILDQIELWVNEGLL